MNLSYSEFEKIANAENRTRDGWVAGMCKLPVEPVVTSTPAEADVVTTTTVATVNYTLCAQF